MKRKLLVLVALVLVGAMALLLVLPGCGGDKGKAKEYMKNTEDMIDGMESKTEKFLSDLQGLFAKWSEGAITTVAQLKSETEGVEEQMDELLGEAKEAIDELDKILDLKGVEDYAQYAKYRLSIIENNLTIAENIEYILNEMESILTAVESGQEVNQEAIVSKLMEIAEKITELEEVNEELDKKAEDLKSEKKL